MRPRLLLAAAVLGVLAACSRSDTTTTTSGPHPWTKPGVLRMAGLSDPDTLSPLVGNFQIDVDLSMFWAGYLFKNDDKTNVVPELATEVPTYENKGISKDGLTITYHLRSGVKWHDGVPFTAKDVVFSWHAVMNPQNNVGTRQGYDLVTRIDTPDPYTAIVHLKKPFAPFVATFFAMSGTTIPIYPEHLLAKEPNLNRIPYNAKPIGTGPFIVSEWHRGQVLRMTANPNYWRGAPKLKEVQYRVIPDENTVVTAAKTHEVDFVFNLSTANYPQVKDIPGSRAVLTPFTRFSHLAFNQQRGPLTDVRVRRALALALDRKRLMELVTYGTNVLGEGDQPAFNWAHDENLKPIPFDPAAARQLLDEAGWKAGADGIRSRSGVRLHLDIAATAGNRVSSQNAVQLQAAWKGIGVDVGVRNYQSALMFSSYGAGGILQGGKFDIGFLSYINGTDPDDSYLLLCSQFPPNGQNIYHYCNKDVDAQEQIALTHYDRPTRKAAYAKIQQHLVSDVPFLTLWFNQQLDVVNDDLKNYKPAHAVTTLWNTEQLDI